MEKKITTSKVIKKEGKIITAAVFVAFFLFVFSTADQTAAAEINTENVIQLVNKERLSRGLSILTENKLLSSAAADKLNDMLKNDYFAHTSPKGTSPWHWIEKNGYDYQYAGENLAINFKSAESQHKAWMQSATHRKNILNSNYREIGIAVGRGKIDGEKTTIVVQLFGAPRVAAIRQSQESIPEKAAVVPMREVAGQEQKMTPTELESMALKNEFIPIDPRKITAPQPICENGVCYFIQSESPFVSQKYFSERTVWLAVVIVMIISISVNILTLSRQDEHNPFIAANTVVLMLVLTSVILW